MTRYQLTVVKIEPNPLYDEEKATEDQARRAGGYNYGPGYNVPPESHTRQLEVTLAEMEFEAIKRAVMEVWK